MLAIIRIAIVTLALPIIASAQTFPTKPVRIVVGFAAGGAADTLARSTTPKLSELLGQPVIVENRPGAGGVIGADNVAKSPPDGHTVLLAAINHYLAPFFQKTLPYETVKDFVPIVILADGFSVLAVHPSLPVNSMADLIAYAKKNPGKLSYGTVGIGSLHHLGGVLLAQAAGIAMEHVPYKGGSPTINDVLGGSLPMAILNVATIMPHARSGKLRALGLIDAKRSRSFPDVPTIGETVPGYSAPGQWFGIIGPSAIPGSIIARLNGDFRRTIAEPDVQKRMESLGFEVAGNTPEEFAARVRSEFEVIRKAVSAAGIKPE
jgi:tripartite-type tricarboxylate transporter receptor subunit TctC